MTISIQSLNALIEALKTGAPIHKVLIANEKVDRKEKKTAQILDLCKRKKIPFQLVPQVVLQRKAGPDHQGVFAEMAAIRSRTIEELLEGAKKGLFLVLDSITDTGNMGAIIRSAVAADVDGIIVNDRNSAPFNETVLKTSAGTLVKARIARVTNLVQAVNKLKENGFWIVGTAMDGYQAYYDYDFSYKTAVVMGSEDRGMSALLKKNADVLLSIPYPGKVESLNVSVASALVLFEALRQKR